VDPMSVPTREEVLWRVDCIVTWDAPSCELPEALRSPELNIMVGKGAYKFDTPRHFIRVGFEINAPDEQMALDRARQELGQHFRTMEERHGADATLPHGIDLHPDRIVVDRLAARRVVSSPDLPAGAGAARPGRAAAGDC
jgi:hypothetical protein